MSISNPDYSELNFTEMAAAIGLKEKHMPMLIGSFLEEAEPLLSSIEEAINSKDYSAIQSSAHSIKGSAGNLRFGELQEMAKELEFAGAQADENFEFTAYFEALKRAISTIKA